MRLQVPKALPRPHPVVNIMRQPHPDNHAYMPMQPRHSTQTTLLAPRCITEPPTRTDARRLQNSLETVLGVRSTRLHTMATKKINNPRTVVFGDLWRGLLDLGPSFALVSRRAIRVHVVLYDCQAACEQHTMSVLHGQLIGQSTKEHPGVHSKRSGS